PGGGDVVFAEVAGVGHDLGGGDAAVGDGLVDQGRKARCVRRAGADIGADDDLIGVVDHGLTVVAVVKRPVGGLHDPGVGIGEVALGLGIRDRLLGGLGCLGVDGVVVVAPPAGFPGGALGRVGPS